MKDIAILGCGGHASVVRDACDSAGFRVIRFVVEKGMRASAPEADTRPLEIGRDEPIDIAHVGTKCFALGIGANADRLWWATKLLREGCDLPPIVHPRAWVSPSAHLAKGVFVGAGAIIQANARLKNAALVNTNATVEHHCDIGPGAHIGPGSILAGLVTVGEYTFVGAGAVLKDRVIVGTRVIIAAGAAVIDDVADGLVIAGVPAKQLKASN